MNIYIYKKGSGAAVYNTLKLKVNFPPPDHNPSVWRWVNTMVREREQKLMKYTLKNHKLVAHSKTCLEFSMENKTTICRICKVNSSKIGLVLSKLAVPIGWWSASYKPKILTLPQFNMEPKIWVPKGISYSREPFSGSMLNFGRVLGMTGRS